MTPTPDEVTERIYTVFEAGWGATSSFTLGNEPYDPPFGADWVRVTVQFDLSDQQTLGSIGNRKYLRGGTIQIQCFQPNSTGTARSAVLAKTAANIFEGKKLGEGVENVDAFEATITTVGSDDFWYQVNTSVRFEYEEIN